MLSRRCFSRMHRSMLSCASNGFPHSCGQQMGQTLTRRCHLQLADLSKLCTAKSLHVAGVYVWGKDWIQAKTQAECYDYLFEAAVKMAQLGINASVPPPPPLITADGAAAVAEGKRHAENGVHAGGFWGGLTYTLHQPLLPRFSQATHTTCMTLLLAVPARHSVARCPHASLTHVNRCRSVCCVALTPRMPLVLLCIVTTRSRESFLIVSTKNDSA